MNSLVKKMLGGTAAFAAILGLGILIGRFTASNLPASHVLRDVTGYTYTKPVLLCNQDVTQTSPEDSAIHTTIQNYINSAQEQDVAVFFLGLSSYSWASINGNESFSPASMLKVPAMVTVLKYAQSHPEILSKQIYYDGSFDDNKAEFFKPAQAIQPYHSYTVDELLTYMIEYSDNNAARLLDNAIDRRDLNDIYIDLGIQIPVMEGPVDFMSPKTYSLFMRLLYNSTYLSGDLSEKALKLLTYPDFPQGLQAGVPSSVQVAQKFGERQILEPNGTPIERELHDCGIVYYPTKPYILCVMTRGKDFTLLASEIAGVSKVVYDGVSNGL